MMKFVNYNIDSNMFDLTVSSVYDEVCELQVTTLILIYLI